MALVQGPLTLLPELERSFAPWPRDASAFVAATDAQLVPALRASHAKPWADCATDAERLDVFNGFLLSANLDALFDRFLISFSDAGDLLVSPQLSSTDRQLLGLDGSLKLRWLAPAHGPYLAFHRDRFEAAGA